MTDQRTQSLLEQRERIKHRSLKQIIVHETINSRFIISLTIEDGADATADEVADHFRTSLIDLVDDSMTITDINDLVYDAMASQYPDRHIEVTVNDALYNVGYYVVYNLTLPTQSTKI